MQPPFQWIRIIAVLALQTLPGPTHAQEVKVILTGNTRDLNHAGDIFPIIASYSASEKLPVLWTLNGDLFPLTTPDSAIMNWVTEAIVLLEAHPNLQILITQGDRDWDDSKKKGWKQAQALEKLLTAQRHQRLHIFIEQGCPGPWTFSFSPSVELVMFNSQWWNHPFEKPMPGSGHCSIVDTDIFIEEFEGLLDENSDKNLLILSHFPLESLGKYGGRFPLSTFLLPPIIGSAIAGYHQNVGTPKDINNERYKTLRYKVEGLLQNYSSLIFGSSHEPAHFIMKSGQNYYINSGALAHSGFVTTSRDALISSSDPGFIELTYRNNGEISYHLYHPLNGKVSAGKKGLLFYSSCESSSAVPKNTSYNPCQKMVMASEVKQIDVSMPTHAMGGEEYESGRFKETWLGKHYRSSWTASVKVPYLNMDTTAGGLTITGKGGGRQTTSMKLMGANGQAYVFRSVNKDPSKALPLELRGTIVSDVLKDQTSTQHPYGAIAVSYWLDKINILHATPALYVLPDSRELGIFREQYKNLFGMLEIRPTDKIEKGLIFGGADDIEKSFKMFDKMYDDHDNKVDRKEFVKARVFDIWIGDWSKHEDNWKWAGYKQGAGETFRPIPRDRDHAFSRWDGIIPWLGDREWAMPNGENFDVRIKGLRSLVWQARHLDRFIANEVTREQWVNAAKEIQSAISSKDIEDGIRKMPAEVYEVDGKEIESKLKARIADLPVYSSRYYEMLAKEVDVVGSNKEEHFEVIRLADGSVEVTVSDLKDDHPNPLKIFYKRKFYPQETKEIRLFGLGDDDIFHIHGESKNSILVRVISGDGHDIITDSSSVSRGGYMTKIYEKEKDAKISLGSEGSRVTPKYDALYQYDRNAFKYNTYLPIALVSYNPFAGFSIQGGATFTNQHFGKPDFSTKHQLKGSVSTEGNFEISYGNQFRHVLGKWDAIGEFVLSRPLNYNFFFGIGNDTQQDEERPKTYYRAQYNMASVSAGLTRSILGQSIVLITANYQLNDGLTKPNTFLADNPDEFGVEKLSLYFLNGQLDFDFRDRASLPEHGFRFFFNQSVGHVSGDAGGFASITEGKIENYFSTYTSNPLTLGLSLGAGTTHGDLPFYKLFSLGQMNNLQGFKRNRFTGQSKAYLNTELRWQLTETRNTFIPLKIGVRGFYDIGRVWADTDTAEAKYWHHGYGGGFYITPFREQFAFNISAGSSKEESFILMMSVGSFLR